MSTGTNPSYLSSFNLSGLGDDDEPVVRVVLGGNKLDNGEGATHVQVTPQDAIKLRVDDAEWEDYQRYKAFKAAQMTANGGVDIDRNVTRSNAPVGLRETVKIIVDESPDMPPTGYPVGLNGTAYIIRPGVPVDVPLGVMEVIRHAVLSVPVVDNLTQKVIAYRDRPRIPWRYAS